MAQITLDKVEKSFGNVAVIKEVDLAVNDGELMVFVGPSGCGKSTLLRLIAGLDQPTGGMISIDGKAVNKVPAADRGLAMVFQSYALYPHMSVKQNLAFGLENARTPQAEIDSRIIDAARMLDIEPYLNRRPGQLSGGQRQRVAIGRAIVRRPVAFLLDEPLSNLDAELRVSTRAEIAALHARIKSTMIYVTHDQTEAMTLADRIVVLRAGQVEQVGSPLELFNGPANAFVGGFIGSPRMSFLAGTVTSIDGERVQARLKSGGMVDFVLNDRPVKTGDAVSVGVRPQQLTLGEGEGSLAAQVTLVEHLGAETIVHAVAGDEQLMAVLHGQLKIRPGEQAGFAVAQAPLHVFDAEGQRLNAPVTG